MTAHHSLQAMSCKKLTHLAAPTLQPQKSPPLREQRRAFVAARGVNPGAGRGNYLPVPVATSSSTFSDTSVSFTPFGLDFMFDDQFVA